MAALALLFSAYLLVDGVLALASAVRAARDRQRWLLALGGLVSVVSGIVLALWPIAGAITVVRWLGVYALVFGITLIVLALRLRRRHHLA